MDIKPYKSKFSEAEGSEEEKAKSAINELGDSDWGKSNESQGKAVQTMKGLAFNDSDLANEFMDKLNKYSTELQKELLGGESAPEGEMEEGNKFMPEEEDSESDESEDEIESLFGSDVAAEVEQPTEEESDEFDFETEETSDEESEDDESEELDEALPGVHYKKKK